MRKIENAAEMYANTKSNKSDKEHLTVTPWNIWNIHRNSFINAAEFIKNNQTPEPTPLQGEEAAVKSVEQAAIEYAEGMMGIGSYDAKWHYNDKVMYNNLRNAYKSGAQYASQFQPAQEEVVQTCSQCGVFVFNADGTECANGHPATPTH